MTIIDVSCQFCTLMTESDVNDDSYLIMACSRSDIIDIYHRFCPFLLESVPQGVLPPFIIQA